MFLLKTEPDCLNAKMKKRFKQFKIARGSDSIADYGFWLLVLKVHRDNAKLALENKQAPGAV